uniref:guanine nucleotide exchange factor for Rab-3A-like n=1 Tax=Oncorhynchus gorbuscha TaxID=8017 RepID=UPI001EAEDAD9|nr:guanine nucleotide exchange factor for Rab-3A-like [Oncorhynchus gorbuscha]
MTTSRSASCATRDSGFSLKGSVAAGCAREGPWGVHNWLASSRRFGRFHQPQEGAVTQARSRGREGSRLEGATQLEVALGGEHEDNVSRLRSSSLEIREKGSEILREQLDAAQKELKLKDKECERLSLIRDQLEQELEELTASLFEEAHKMVREANVKQAAAEKQLKEAQGKIDVLQAEVSALKTMVLTSTPSSPNRQAHPQLLSPGTRSKGAGPRHGGGHTRNKSASWALPLAPGGTDSHSLQPVREDKEERGESFITFASPALGRSAPSFRAQKIPPSALQHCQPGTLDGVGDALSGVEALFCPYHLRASIAIKATV